MFFVSQLGAILAAILNMQAEIVWTEVAIGDLRYSVDYQLRKEVKNYALYDVADYDGDGIKDSVRMVSNKNTGAFAFQMSLSTKPDQPIYLAEGRQEDVARLGVASLSAGKHSTSCAKGYGAACGANEPSEINLKNPGFYIFMFESSAEAYYIKDGTLKTAFLSD